MPEPTIRSARPSDIDQLVDMRWDFTYEGKEPVPDRDPSYDGAARAFLNGAIARNSWEIWVAEMDGRLVSHAFVALIDKVPRPGQTHSRIAYLTNVYTLPDYRGRGIGARVVQRAQDAAQLQAVELMIVWPSDESVDFYAREGFMAPKDLLVWAAK